MAADGLHRRLGLSQVFLAARADDDLRPFFSQPDRRRASDPVAAAGDEHDLPLHTIAHCLSFSRWSSQSPFAGTLFRNERVVSIADRTRSIESFAVEVGQFGSLAEAPDQVRVG